MNGAKLDPGQKSYVLGGLTYMLFDFSKLIEYNSDFCVVSTKADNVKTKIHCNNHVRNQLFNDVFSA